MNERLILAGVCVLIVLASLGSLVYLVASGQLLTLDGLLLAHIALLLAGVFSLFAAWIGCELGYHKHILPFLPEKLRRLIPDACLK